MKEAKGDNRDELKACRQWVRSLTKDEMLSAMEFALVEDDSGTSSHEYDILKEMLQLQSQPPTPIHPRALSFRPASQFGPSDGRDEVARVYQNRFRRPRLFQLLERGSTGCGSARLMLRGRRQTCNSQQQTPARSTLHRRFDVVAKRFIAPWGQVLSVGCTAEQNEADDILLKASAICHKPDGRNVTTLSCCFMEHSMDGTRCEGANGILRILQVASRGRFLSAVAAPTDRKSRSIFAPWFDPCQQWFSLPMYLASRFEMALWYAFRNRDSTLLTKRSLPMEDVADKLGQDRLRLLIQRAALKSLVADILSKDVSDCQIRDSLLWQLLSSSSSDNAGLLFSETPMLSIWISPLVELETPVDRIRRFLRNHLQEIVAQEMERSLLERFTDDFNEAETHQRKRKKKNSKKKRRTTAKDLPGHDDLMSCPSDEQEELDVFSPNDPIQPTLPITYPNNDTSARQRTRNIIACLTILEETIESVFEKVGLPKTEPFVEEISTTVDSANHKIVFGSNNNTQAQNNGNRDTTALQEESSHHQINDTEHREDSSPDSTTTDGQQPNTAATRGPDDEEHRKRSRSQSPVKTAPMAKVDDRQVDEDLCSQSPSHDSSGKPRRETIIELEIFPHRSPPMDFTWGFFDENIQGHSTRFHSRDRSILEELFLDQERHDSKNGEVLPASSTAASIASSSNKEIEAVEIDEVEGIDKGDLDDNSTVQSTVLEVIELPLIARNGSVIEEAIMESAHDTDHSESRLPQEQARERLDTSSPVGETHKSAHGSRSPSPQAPATPSPRLSPILFSLADLRNLRRSAFSEHNRTPKGQTQSTALTAGSLPSSPVPLSSNGLTLTWSREDLRISSCRDDLQITGKQRVVQQDHAFTSYARVASKTFAKPLAPARRIDPKGMQISQKQDKPDAKVNGLGLPPLKPDVPEDVYAKSETYAEGQGEENNWNDAPRTSTSEEVDGNTITRDGSTTITSALSQRDEESAALREERNSYRDLCLTLGSEVAKLRNLLAAHKGASIFVPVDFSQSYPIQLNHSVFDPASMRPFFQSTFSGQTLGTMSDAGLHRGDESQVSEDDHHDSAGFPRTPSNKRPSSIATPTGSDTSVEPCATSFNPAETLPLNRDSHEAIVSHGLHSRLTKDIINFLNATTVQLRKQDTKRRAAFERMTRLVTTLWPRAQVKLYGSHVTGLCLPSSDLDFVICLPAVHKNALAVAPGVLEGRNAINETSQKFLARKLKGESWIDPRSIKTIERTVVPVIKVSTKDARARVLQLDISFDSPEHHGLEAADMIRSIMDELPMIRPLVLVLKQFLLDRGLLTAYTGGLSSYCLFLMVARYLQEQPPSWGDCGSLLMGFLDFYGNSFDPRALGISVRRRQYFARPNYAPPRNLIAGQPLWNTNHLQPAITIPQAMGRPDFSRRNSFSDRGNVDAARGVTPASLSRPPRFQPSPSQRFVPHVSHHTDQSTVVPSAGVAFDHGRPYTFDPLFVEDPLSPGNNVGRNAFRIFQVQRAFSDAHRALVASLEWDLHSSGELNDSTDYPLLKCLLQSEDVFYEL
jgi:hypothetical protein